MNIENKKPSAKSKRVLFVIPEWLHAELERKAIELGVNTSEAVREAIREFVKK